MVKTCATPRSGAFWRFGTETALVDLQGANPRLERRPRNPESRRCPRRPEHPSAAGAQGVLDDRLLVCGQRARQAEPTLDELCRWQPTLVDRKFVGVRHDD